MPIDISKIDLSKVDINILFQRQNAFYSSNIKKWRRGMAAYGGGAAYVNLALIKHTNEIPPEYAERLARAAYVNYPRRVATLITQYVLSKRPTREGANSEFVEDFSRTGMRVDEVMRQFSTYLNICGAAWLCVDSPEFDGEPTKADEQRERLRPYGIALSPISVPDWHYGADGKLEWVLTAETRIDNKDPFSNAKEISIRKLWTRDYVVIAYHDKTSGDKTARIVNNPIGEVPFVRHVEVDGYGIGENHWFEDVVRISDAILNANSEAQMNVLKQMFGLLVIPEDFLDTVKDRQENGGNADSGDSNGGKASEPLSYTLARSAAVFESADGANITRYIQPAGTETATIRTEVDALKKELYSVVGLAASKDTKAVESAEAKAWDFLNVEAYMETHADILEQCEVKAWELLNKWQPNIPVPSVSYNRNFSTLDIKDAVANLVELSGFCQDNDPYQRSIGKVALSLLNRMYQLPADVMEEITNLIDTSTPGTDKKEQQEMMEEMRRNAELGGEEDGDGDGDGDKGGKEQPEDGKKKIGFKE